MPLSIDVWSDIACPWCWIGKRRLELALDDFGSDVEVSPRAFQLDPAAPREAPAAVDYAARLADKYRCSRAEAREMIDRMVAAGRAEGVEMRFDRIRPSNTFDAHRLLAWARGAGRSPDLAGRLFAAYLGEGRSVSDHAELARLAGEAGLDTAEAGAILAAEDYAIDVRSDLERAREIGITGVPFFVFAGRLAVSGAQSPATLLGVMRRAAAEDAPDRDGSR